MSMSVNIASVKLCVCLLCPHPASSGSSLHPQPTCRHSFSRIVGGTQSWTCDSCSSPPLVQSHEQTNNKLSTYQHSAQSQNLKNRSAYYQNYWRTLLLNSFLPMHSHIASQHLHIYRFLSIHKCSHHQFYFSSSVLRQNFQGSCPFCFWISHQFFTIKQHVHPLGTYTSHSYWCQCQCQSKIILCESWNWVQI